LPGKVWETEVNSIKVRLHLSFDSTCQRSRGRELKELRDTQGAREWGYSSQYLN